MTEALLQVTCMIPLSFLKPHQGAVTHSEVGRRYGGVKPAIPNEFGNYQSSQKFPIFLDSDELAFQIALL